MLESNVRNDATFIAHKGAVYVAWSTEPWPSGVNLVEIPNEISRLTELETGTIGSGSTVNKT